MRRPPEESALKSFQQRVFAGGVDRAADPVLPANLRRLDPRFRLLQHPDDLLLREPALPHLWSSSGFYTLENSHLHWYCFRGAGHPLNARLTLQATARSLLKDGRLCDLCQTPIGRPRITKGNSGLYN